LYNIRWMLTMQDPNDGGVYHKCTNAKFDAMVMPDKATEKRYVVQKSTAATLDLAAVCAQASRIFSNYKKQFPGLSDSCLNAALKAWQWAEKNPNVLYRQNAMNKQFQPAITTGDYGDNNVTDEFFWAACELYATTNNEGYWKVIDTTNQHKMSLPSWGNVYALGMYTLMRMHPAKHLTDVEGMSNLVVAFADSIANNMQSSAFATVIGGNKRDFNWGSNSNAANQSIVLINAYHITKNKKYLDIALANLDYILGRNATGYCFVTGIGTKSTMHPHHRPSIADGIEEPVPGLLAGGPNPGRQDGCKYDFVEPETAYVDNDCSYASNEIAINWNAPLVYVSNAIEALQKKF
jgi:endoglucanase